MTVDEATSARPRSSDRPAVVDAVNGSTAVSVFFLSDSTGISAETMGNALLIQFPGQRFDRRLIPFITSVEEARRVVTVLDAAADGPAPAIAFTTAAVEEIRLELAKTRCPTIDFFDLHMRRVESILGVRGLHVASRLHGVGDIQRYNARMAAVEYAVEHDDGQSLRALDRADVILLAPSRCGKTPTTMYLALQHGVFVANYPLLPEDLDSDDLPRPVRHLRDRCFGITTTPARLAPGSDLVPIPRHPADQLLRQVGGRDVHSHPPGPQEPLIQGASHVPKRPLVL
jgi:regulator of PEP synthase PpsR (kinase-PPPase family)